MSTHHSRYSAALLAIVLLTGGAGAARADIAVITAQRDNTLFEDASGSLSNGAGPSVFAGNNSGGSRRRGLFHFELLGVLPVGAAIDSVELQLYVSNAPNEEVQVFSVHQVLADWGEGTSVSLGGGGAPSTTGDATWLHRFYPSTNWASLGGDYDPAPHATASVGGVGFYLWGSKLLTADVKAWWNEPASNFGWLIAGNEAVASSARRFESHETAIAAQRPQLVIHYSRPIPADPSTWGRIKSLYFSW